jgi:hypothetical protein
LKEHAVIQREPAGDLAEMEDEWLGVERKTG